MEKKAFAAGANETAAQAAASRRSCLGMLADICPFELFLSQQQAGQGSRPSVMRGELEEWRVAEMMSRASYKDTSTVLG